MCGSNFLSLVHIGPKFSECGLGPNYDFFPCYGVKVLPTTDDTCCLINGLYTCYVLCIMVYGSTPYVQMAPKKMAAAKM